MPTIRIEKASKYYKSEKNKYPAISDISITIRQGEFVFVVGSSGAGKSTLLQLISGDLRPEKGSVYLDNLNLSRVPPWYFPKVRLTFGLVRQEPQLMRKRTIRENLAAVSKLGLKTRKKQQDEKIQKVLGIVGMPGVEDKYPQELSIGEVRRVDLARALINSPPILILDELTANLDDDTSWDLFQLLIELNRQGTTIVMATHASNFVNILRRRVITLVDGQIAADMPRGKYGDIRKPILERPPRPRVIYNDKYSRL